MTQEQLTEFEDYMIEIYAGRDYYSRGKII